MRKYTCLIQADYFCSVAGSLQGKGADLVINPSLNEFFSRVLSDTLFDQMQCGAVDPTQLKLPQLFFAVVGEASVINTYAKTIRVSGYHQPVKKIVDVDALFFQFRYHFKRQVISQLFVEKKSFFEQQKKMLCEHVKRLKKRNNVLNTANRFLMSILQAGVDLSSSTLKNEPLSLRWLALIYRIRENQIVSENSKLIGENSQEIKNNEMLIEQYHSYIVGNKLDLLQEAVNKWFDKIGFSMHQFESLTELCQSFSPSPAHHVLFFCDRALSENLYQKDRSMKTVSCYSGGEISVLDQEQMTQCLTAKQDNSEINEILLVFSGVQLFESHFEVRNFRQYLRKLLKEQLNTNNLNKVSKIEFIFFLPSQDPSFDQKKFNLIRPIFFDSRFTELAAVYSKVKIKFLVGSLTSQQLVDFENANSKRMVICFETDMDKALGLQLHCESERCHILRVYRWGMFQGVFSHRLSKWLSIKSMPPFISADLVEDFTSDKDEPANDSVNSFDLGGDEMDHERSENIPASATAERIFRPDVAMLPPPLFDNSGATHEVESSSEDGFLVVNQNEM